MILYLELKHIMAMHRVLLEKYGGLEGVRDQGLLESALAQPSQNVFGEDLFPDLYSKAAAYAFYLSENQPFVDGNKRIATAAALTFLRLNGYEIKASEKQVYEVIMQLANRQMMRDQLSTWFKKHSKKKSK
ncbi:MAG: type II toxin-antitoxin system death-on-curing family toxin [Deltaproteobacteria bacterium]|nr:type II toxin-antitoxin system death-on-curing family toxin [Deltaproteobacteria bacterium]